MSLHLVPATATPRLSDRLLRLVEGQWDRWPLWLPVAMGVGVIGYFALPAEPGPGPLFLPWPLLALALLLRRRQPLLAAAVALLGAVALGFAAASWQSRTAPPLLDLPRTAVIATGRVAAVDLLPEGRRVTLEGARLNDGAPLGREIRIRLRTADPARPKPGDALTVRALIRPPAPPAYPGAWDFQRNAFFSGLGGSGFAIGPATVVPGESTPVFAGLRAHIDARVTASLPGATGSVAAALLTGSQSAIPPDVLAALRDSGLAHLLSPSGLHVAIVIGLGYVVIRRVVAAILWLALRLETRGFAAVAGLVLGGGYTLLTGAGVPMVRSFAMAALATLAILTGRRALSLRGVALAAGVILLVSPAALLGPSMQMSFAAVLALVAAAEAMRAPSRALRSRGWWGRAALALIGMVMTSVIAGAATTPFGLHHFGRLQLYGVAANAVAVPLTSFLVMPAGALALLLMPLGWEGPALAAMGWGVDGTILVGRTIAAWPGAALTAAPIPAWGIAVFGLGLCWVCLWRGNWRWPGIAMMAAGLLSGSTVTAPDLLVSADARLIALSTPQGIFVERASGASRLTRESWLRSWGEDGAQPLPATGTAAEGRITCAGTACVLRPHPEGAAAALLRRPPPETPRRRGTPAPPVPPVRAETGCGQAELLVSAEPIRGRCRDTPMLDRFSVWRDGAHAVWLGRGGAVVLSDRGFRGNRPWVPPVPEPRPRPPSEPAAERDPGGEADPSAPME
ncbi:ComEC/Rec2 family competence protein [Muricoccus radiodurans]|uniref:ComEC/Rec2 family competence protein n=1 Tax=Muricoccus radiodurans TaxID=2231721 RepID=UPI003CFACF8B